MKKNKKRMINSVKKNLRNCRSRFKRFKDRVAPVAVTVEKETIKKMIVDFKSGNMPVLFRGFESKGAAVGLLDLFDFDSVKNIKDGADMVCGHKFDLLGSGIVDLGEKIAWNADFKTGYQWPKKYFLDMVPIDPIGDPIKRQLKYDGKVPWELSRCQHFAVLGQAYLITGDAKYSLEFVGQAGDWMENNPPLFGVNWTCPMEASIRASNWIYALYLFRGARELTDDFLTNIFENLIVSGRFIEKNLEKSWRGLTANHYLSDVAGLIFLGIFFKGTSEGKKWRDFGIGELKKEMEKQVYPDGCDFEASTCYHRLVLELFLFSTVFAVVNDADFDKNNYKEICQKIFGKEYVSRFYKMFEVVLYLVKPDGRIPQIGDNDNGQFFIFKKRDLLDMRYLLCLGAVFFREPKFKVKEFGFCEESLWVFGKDGYGAWALMEENNIENIRSRDFYDGGWHVFRDNGNYCLISCGSNGQNGNGGHCHNDKLSFELAVGGRDLVIDTGTFIYTGVPELRDEFRSTAFHNTIKVDGEEQNRFIRNNLFSLKNDAKIKIIKRDEIAGFDILVAEHYGYRRLKEPVTHRRIFVFNRESGYLAIKDIMTGIGCHVFDFYLHPFAPYLEKDFIDPLIARAKNPNGVNFAVIPLEIVGLKLDLVDGWISSCYGKKDLVPVVKYSKTARAPVVFATLIVPERAKTPDADSIKENLKPLFKNLQKYE